VYSRTLKEVTVRTNIDLNEALVEEGMKLSGSRTKKELVHRALEEFVETRRRLDVRDLRGKVSFHGEYDHKRLRREESV
jgi:Arc/MetJ family transcription regulator